MTDEYSEYSMTKRSAEKMSSEDTDVVDEDVEMINADVKDVEMVRSPLAAGVDDSALYTI